MYEGARVSEAIAIPVPALDYTEPPPFGDKLLATGFTFGA